MAERILLTPAGRDNLMKELEFLRGPKRALMSEALREARSHGDLRENAAYDEAKLNQARLEGRIKDVEWVLEHSHIVERPDGMGEMIHLGSKASIRDLQFDEEMELTLVGGFEADPTHGLVSIISPLGKALIGRTEGETVTCETPRGEASYQILKVVHLDDSLSIDGG